jgi:hypothetical protein
VKVGVYQRAVLPACGGWKICAEYVSGRFLRNVGVCLPNYTASYPRRLFLQGRRIQDRKQKENQAGNVGINVILRPVSVTVIAMEKQHVPSVCVKP